MFFLPFATWSGIVLKELKLPNEGSNKTNTNLLSLIQILIQITTREDSPHTVQSVKTQHYLC